MSELTMAAADREAFLAEPHIGVLTIARAEGQPPLASPIWYEYVDGVVAINVGRGSEKARRAEATGSASLTVQTEQLPYRFVTVGGSLTIGPADDATRRRIASRYMPPRCSTTTSRPATPPTWSRCTSPRPRGTPTTTRR